MRNTTARVKSTALMLAVACGGCAGGARLDLPIGERAFAATAGDVNGDGKVDLVATGDLGEPGDALSVWLGRGDGTFEPPSHSPLTAASRSEAVVVADLDRDDHADAITANTELFTVEAFLGDGRSGFRSRATRSTAEEPQSLAAGDLDGDGWVDCAVAHRDDGGAYLSVLFGRGDGDFAGTSIYSGEAGTVAFDVAIGDVNGDERLDVVTAGLAGGAALRVHLNQGEGQLEALAPIAGGLRGVTLIDVDRDGHLDLVAIERDLVNVLYGSGDGGFAPGEQHAIGASATALLAQDLDGDGLSDFAVARDDDYVTVFWGAATGSERRRQDLATGEKPVSIGAADFNGDARLELFTANGGSPGSLTVLTL
jgi:hypothetical protein